MTEVKTYYKTQEHRSPLKGCVEYGPDEPLDLKRYQPHVVLENLVKKEPYTNSKNSDLYIRYSQVPYSASGPSQAFHSGEEGSLDTLAFWKSDVSISVSSTRSPIKDLEATESQQRREM